MSIDWTEAPEGATHYDTLADVFCNVCGWWENFRYHEFFGQDSWGTDRYTSRPVEPATTAWDGTGLPPVGTECEALWLETPDFGGRDFEPVLIKGYFDALPGRQAWFSTGEGEDFARLTENVNFRPIRTKAQIEQEELEDLLTRASETGLTVKSLAGFIIAKGFRLER